MAWTKSSNWNTRSTVLACLAHPGNFCSARSISESVRTVLIGNFLIEWRLVYFHEPQSSQVICVSSLPEADGVAPKSTSFRWTRGIDFIPQFSPQLLGN